MVDRKEFTVCHAQQDREEATAMFGDPHVEDNTVHGTAWRVRWGWTKPAIPPSPPALRLPFRAIRFGGYTWPSATAKSFLLGLSDADLHTLHGVMDGHLYPTVWRTFTAEVLAFSFMYPEDYYPECRWGRQWAERGVFEQWSVLSWTFDDPGGDSFFAPREVVLRIFGLNAQEAYALCA